MSSRQTWSAGRSRSGRNSFGLDSFICRFLLDSSGAGQLDTESRGVELEVMNFRVVA